MPEQLRLRYTLALVRDYRDGEEWVLLLHRTKEPNKGLWNGVGGKILFGETPFQGLRREVMEETGIEVDSVRFTGIVTWAEWDGSWGGAYLYEVHLPVDCHWRHFDGKDTDEGQLRWFFVDHVLGERFQSPPVVDHMRAWLPHMINGMDPQEFRCFYGDRGELERVEISQLTIDLEGVI